MTSALDSNLLPTAREYFSQGFSIVPVRLRPSGGRIEKKPAIAWEPYKTRLAEEDEIRAWFSDPTVNGLGVVLGSATWARWPHLWVLDVEAEHRAEGERLLSERLGPEWRHRTWWSETVSGGLHVYFLAWEPVRTAKCALGDIKGEGSLVVLPPSKLPNGRGYRWGRMEGDPAPINPEDLGLPVRTRLYQVLAERPLREGERNSTLTSLAGYLRRAGFGPDLIEIVLQTANQERCDPPLGKDEIERIARSVGRYPAGGPHPAPRAGVDGHTAEVNTPPRPALAVAVPPFPVDVLPGQFRKFVMEVADGLGCPPDFVAVPLLPVAAAAVGNRLSIRLNSLWRERPILWTAVVGDPGSGKSPALEQILLPLGRLQTEDYQQWTARLAAWEEERIRAEKEKRKPPPRPRLRHWFTTDVTLEAIAQMLRPPRSEEAEDEETPGLVILMDELTAWVNSFDAYHKRGERERWLQLWAGVAVKVDRATKDPVLISEPAISVAGGIVPDRLPALEAEARIADGFIERILYTFPDAGVLERFPDPPPLSADLAPLLRRLRQARRGRVGLDPEADASFRAWFAANARQQAAEEFRPLVRYRAKLPRQVARLALVLHAMTAVDTGLEPAEVPLEARTLEAAVRLGEYFAEHAARVMLEFGEGALARRVLGLLAERADGLTRGQLYEALGGRVRAGELDAVRDFLAGVGLIQVEPAPPGPEGGRPGEVWILRVGEKTEKTSPGVGVFSVFSQAPSISSSGPEPAPDGWVEVEW